MQYQTRDEVIEAALSFVRENIERGDVLSDPKAVANYLTIKIGNIEHEVFGCLFLDNRHRMIADEQLFRGTIDGAAVYPREVVKEALKHNAAAVVLYHNHPSGVPNPSRNDEALTRRLLEALALVDVRVLDHFVIGGNDHTSFAEKGLI